MLLIDKKQKNVFFCFLIINIPPPLALATFDKHTDIDEQNVNQLRR
ncbi:hypothetical protein Q7O_002277 [Pectobacterium carotovorum subsp. carotovorum PCCS1]|nr:hypothetical protein [Pectobacterium carotovorum subsp. carotovorum PCCS1]